MLAIAKDYDVIPLLGMKLDFAGNNTDAGTSTVPKRKAQLLEILPALGRNAMSPDDHDRILSLFLRQRKVLLALIVPDLPNVLTAQSVHHLLVVNQRAIRVDPAAPAASLFPGYLNRALHPPTEASAFGSNDFHSLCDLPTANSTSDQY